MVASTATSRQPRYHAPTVASVATGAATRANNAFNGSGPNRARACDNAPVVGTPHWPRHRRAHTNPWVNSRVTSS